MWVVLFTGFPISNVNEYHRPMRNYWIMAIIIYIFNIDFITCMRRLNHNYKRDGLKEDCKTYD